MPVMVGKAQKGNAGGGARPQVVVALLMQGAAGREKLDGVIAEARRLGGWRLSIYRSEAEFSAETVEMELASGADGFIVGLPEARGALSALAGSDVPVVLVDIADAALERRGCGVAFIGNDPAEIGRAAAAEMLATGPRASYGYVGWRRDEAWSVARGQAYAEALAGKEVRFFDHAHCGARIDDPAETARWLRRLPKPCAVFASCDDKAWEIVQICRDAGLAVPEDVAVLGVNDDAALCEGADPRISSVRPDFAGEGRAAARLLEAMMREASAPSVGGAARRRGAGPMPTRRTLAIAGVSRRETTVRPTAASELVSRAMLWLRANALSAPHVEDVARAVFVSPSLLERRFREISGESVYAAALRLRMDEVKRRLRETAAPIAEITRDCGWAEPEPPKRLFKRMFGMSMRKWREEGLGIRD